MSGQPEPLFADRRDAGRKLAEALAARRAELAPEVVLGLARGGVIVAAEVARSLGLELDVLVVRKLGAPQSEELAIGAVTANGGLYLNDEIIASLGIGSSYVAGEIERQRRLAAEREALYRGDRPPSDLTGKSCVLIDDGIATGASMIAAVRSARAQGAGFVTVALPVGSPDGCRDLRHEADEVVCLHQPEPFWAVGIFYADFSQTTDEEVLNALRESITS